MLNIISLGAGVQSSTMALMAAEGELTPMPDCAIFADTGAEPEHVYDFLDYVESLVPFPVYRVMEGEGLEAQIIDRASRSEFTKVPFFTKEKGPGMRQCTADFKIYPINRKVRELIGLKKGQRGPKEVVVKMWIGISMDESVRMKPSRVAWIENTWPLIEKGMHRHDCIQWMRSNEFNEPRKSSCYFCPYRDNQSWIDMQQNDSSSWEKALFIDNLIRDQYPNNPQFIHRSKTPLTECDFDPDRDQFDMFDHECEGMCGV